MTGVAVRMTRSRRGHPAEQPADDVVAPIFGVSRRITRYQGKRIL